MRPHLGSSLRLDVQVLVLVQVRELERVQERALVLATALGQRMAVVHLELVPFSNPTVVLLTCQAWKALPTIVPARILAVLENLVLGWKVPVGP